MSAPSEDIDKHVTRRYDVQQKLGKGAYGIVWKATDRKSRETVALKKIFDAFQNSTDAQRTYREVIYLQQMSKHENIIKLQRVEKADNDRDLYLIFEYMETDLHAVIRANILEEIHKQYIMYQCFKALMCAAGSSYTRLPGRGRASACPARVQRTMCASFAGLQSVWSVRCARRVAARVPARAPTARDHGRARRARARASCAVAPPRRYMHSAGLVHRDIKPSNLLLNSECLMKVRLQTAERSLGRLPPRAAARDARLSVARAAASPTTARPRRPAHAHTDDCLAAGACACVRARRWPILAWRASSSSPCDRRTTPMQQLRRWTAPARMRGLPMRS